MFEHALPAGLTSTGINVCLLGPVPTPAVGLLTTSMRADLGVMISASHNPACDNGIKFFGPDGFKLSDEAEEEIEKLVLEGVEPAQAQHIGRAKRIDDGRFRYIERIKSSLPSSLPLRGLKVVVDCANGAAHKAAPEALWEMGAEVVSVGVSPNGFNINDKCGSTYPATISEAVVRHNAHVGISLDGDADRVMIVDEAGMGAEGDRRAGRWGGGRGGAGGGVVLVRNLGGGGSGLAK